MLKSEVNLGIVSFTKGKIGDRVIYPKLPDRAERVNPTFEGERVVELKV